MIDTLTREQIMAMPAGAEMDALIRRHVFKDDRVHKDNQGVWYVDAAFIESIPPYSTDANAMLEVIENRRKAGYEPTMRWRPKLYDWWVDFQDERGYSHASYGCDDLILSVCRAALLTTLETM